MTNAYARVSLVGARIWAVDRHLPDYGVQRRWTIVWSPERAEVGAGPAPAVCAAWVHQAEAFAALAAAGTRVETQVPGIRCGVKPAW